MESPQQPAELGVDDTAGVESQSHSSQLTYIPPGLRCELDPTEENSLSIYALGKFDVGHVWGPYLIHLSAEAQKMLCVQDERCTTVNLALSVKNSNGVAEETSIMLGEEHLWIRLLYETGMRSPTPERNIDLALDPTTKTITLVVTKDIEAKEKLRGTLRIRSGATKPPTSSNAQMSAASSLMDGSKGLSSCFINSGLQSAGVTGTLKRDKKCHFCGIPFSNLDTLSAHMTYYCSRRLQVGSHSVASNSASSTASPTDTMGTKIIPTSLGPAARSSVVNKRPISRTGVSASHPAGATSSCPTSYPFHLFPKSPTMRTAGNTSSNVVMDSASLITSNPTFSADLVNALCPPNNISAVRTHLTAAILPYLAKLSSTAQTPIAGKSMISPSTTSTEFPVIPLPLGTRLLDSSPKLRTNDSSRILQDSQNTAKQPSETSVPPPRAMPLYCDGCKQYFASDILYTCHLKMSSHLVNFTESRHLKTNGKVRWSLDDNINTGCPFALSSAVSQLGLVLAAPLFTVDGVQYVPVNPKCGLLLSNHVQNNDHVSPDQWVSASGQDTHEEDVTQRSMSAATVTTVTTSITPSSVSSHNVLSALDLSCPLISSDSSVTMLPIQRLFEERVAVNNCQAVIEQSTDSSNKYISPTGTNDSVATNAANKQNLGHISPEMLQLVATLLSSMVIPTGTNRSPPKYVPQAKTDHSMNPEPAISTVPFNLPQFIAQLYLNSIPCNSQNLMNLSGSFDSGANSAISSSTNDMSSAVDSVQPSAPYHQPQLLPAQSSLAHASALTELVPAITVFNSVYQGELCDALGYMESNAHTTSALLPKNFAPSGVECSISPAQSPQPESTPHRPYLCTYCQTRFLAYSTFQAHQQSYCQARRDAIRNPITAPTSSASTMAMTASAVAVSANQPPGLGNSIGPAKRRRTQPISPHALIETQPSTKAPDSRLSFSSSNVSSASGSGDEGDMRRAKEVIASNKTETLKPASKIPSENANVENTNLATVWEQCGSVELRCAACGYVGQTSRGMKMHKRLHECKGVATREAKQSGKKRDRESTNDDSVHLRVDRSREKHSKRGFLMRVPEEPVKSESV